MPGDEFEISVWKPLDTKGKPINTAEPLIYNHYSDHWLTDKSIADCMEALIGAYLMSSGIESTQMFLCHMGNFNSLTKFIFVVWSKIDR